MCDEKGGGLSGATPFSLRRAKRLGVEAAMSQRTKL